MERIASHRDTPPDYMALAFEQAALAVGNSDPNPPVGAVLVHPERGEILGRGYTQPAGFAHAEVCAIEDAIERHGPEAPRGAHLYVTLEPCSHHGRTPPCTHLIIRTGIARVVIACNDPTDKVEGIGALRHAGIETQSLGVTGFGNSPYDEAAFWTLGGFFHLAKTGRPRVFLKWAQTLRGNLAPERGASGPVSGALSKESVYRLRHLLHTTLATPGTVESDRPQLNARYHKEPLGVGGFLGEMLDFPGVRGEQITPQRFFMVPGFSPRWSREDLAEYLASQSALGEKNGWICQDATQAEMIRSMGLEVCLLENYDNFSPVLEYLTSRGALQVLVEAGPLYAEKIWRDGWMDVGVAYMSPREAPWEEKGRGFSLSTGLASREREFLSEEGLTLLVDEKTGEDRLLIFRKDLPR